MEARINCELLEDLGEACVVAVRLIFPGLVKYRVSKCHLEGGQLVAEVTALDGNFLATIPGTNYLSGLQRPQVFIDAAQVQAA